MRLHRCLPALALLLLLPARADDGPAAKPPAQADVKKSDCCDVEAKVKCPKAKAAAASKKSATKTAAATPKPAAAGEASMVVTRDPETGELRNATAAEREKLFAGRAPQAAPVAPRVVTLPDGTKMVELGEETMNYAIATKAPDGSIKQSCGHGAHSATEARAAPKPAPAPGAEER